MTNVLQNRNILFRSDDLKHSKNIFLQWPWQNSLRNICFKCWYGSSVFNLKWGGMCSPRGDVSGLFSTTVPVFSCWTLPYQSVCLLNKIYWLQNEWLPPCVGWLLCWTHTTEIRARLLQLACLEQISTPPPRPLSHLTLWPFKAFQVQLSGFFLYSALTGPLCFSLHSSIPSFLDFICLSVWMFCFF